MSKKIFFSLFSGQVYEIPEDEVLTLDEGQIPLTHGPKPNCPKCYGRGFRDKDHLRNTYSPCRCIIKNIDRLAYESMRSRFQKQPTVTYTTEK
jgi:hypothetical protein